MMKLKKICCGLLILGLLLPLAVVGSQSTAEAAGGTWKHSKKGWWYSYSDGSYARSEWLQDGGKWYYLDSAGYMVTGWKKIGGKWYHFEKDGVMTTKWKRIAGKWYYFGTSGAVATGWKKIGGKFYYFGTDGGMATGWKQIGGKWYFFLKGAMVTGWKKIAGDWYYLAKGVMLTGSFTVGGKEYVFNEKGVLIKPIALKDAKPGSIVTFGRYEQDYNTANGMEKIEWIVLDKLSDGSLFLISKDVLTNVTYHTDPVPVTWEKCYLRKWMNTAFYDTAFNSSEKAKIKNSLVVNNDSTTGTEGGNNTRDRVFALSVDEACRYFINDDGTHDAWRVSKARAAKPTYAMVENLIEWARIEHGVNYSWWLRTPGAIESNAACVDRNGSVFFMGGNVLADLMGVRPAIVITP